MDDDRRERDAYLLIIRKAGPRVWVSSSIGGHLLRANDARALAIEVAWNIGAEEAGA